MDAVVAAAAPTQGGQAAAGRSADHRRHPVGAGTYSAEWYSLTSRETVEADSVTVESGTVRFASPFDTTGPVALSLTRIGGRRESRR
jgi:hypothetical protein